MMHCESIFSNLTTINDSIVDSNETYLGLNKEIIKTLKIISSYIPEDKSDLLNKLEELYSDKECLLETIIYELLNNSKNNQTNYNNIIHIQKNNVSRK